MKRHRSQLLAGLVVAIFLVQLWASVAPSQAGLITPKPADESAPSQFLFLNHTQIAGNPSGSFLLWANGCVYIEANVGGPNVPWGADGAEFTFGEAGAPDWNTTEYTCDTGPHSWAVVLPDQPALYNLSVPAWCQDSFASLAVQPVFLFEGEINTTLGAPTGVDFNASGDIAICAWSLMNFTNLAMTLDGMVLKRNDYSTTCDYPCTLVAGVVFQSEWLRFPATVGPGLHHLGVWGNDTVRLVIVHGSASFSSDGLLDYEKVMSGNPDLDPRYASTWGYHETDQDYNAIPLDQFIQDGYEGGVWVQESLHFYIPTAFSGTQQSLEIFALNGRFANMSVDGDPAQVGNSTLYGYCGDSDAPVTVIAPSGQQIVAPANTIFDPDIRFGGYLTAGAWHTVAYQVFQSPLENPDLRLLLNGREVVIMGEQTNYPTDQDQDGVPDSADLSPSASLVWHDTSVLQLSVPCNRSAGEDVFVKLQVVRPANDHTTTQALDWHAGEDAHQQVNVVPAMILYGPGRNDPATGETKHWSDLNSLNSYLGFTADPQVYNVVDTDANGANYGTLCTSVDCSPLPQDGDKANDAQMLVFPSMAQDVMEFDLQYPADSGAIQSTGVITLRVRWVYAIVAQAWDDPTNQTVLGWYDFDSDFLISGIQVSYMSDINALLAQPRDAITHLQDWCYNMNPQVAMAQDAEFQRSIVASFTGTHFLPQFNRSKDDPSTWGIVERLNLARNQTAWDEQSAEVTYITQTTRTLDLLSKISLGVHYDLSTGADVEYCTYPAMYSFAGCPPGNYLTQGAPAIANWSFLGGTGSCSILRNVQTRANPLQLDPEPAVTVRADRGEENSTGQVDFGVYCESPGSSLEVDIGNGGTPNAIVLVVANGNLEYRDASGAFQHICSLWPGEWFDITVLFDCTAGTFDVFVDGAMQFGTEDIPFCQAASGVQAMTFTASGGPVDLSAAGIYWEYNDPCVPPTTLTYENVHFGDVTERTSFYEVGDIYNGTYAPGDPEMSGSQVALWATYYSSTDHAMERVRVENWPNAASYVRAGDPAHPGFTTDNFIDISYAQDTFLPASWGPGQLGAPYSWVGRDVPDTTTFNDLLVNEWAAPASAQVPATICLHLGDDARFQVDFRVGEVDPWAAYVAPHSEPRIVEAVDASIANALLNVDQMAQWARQFLQGIANGGIPDQDVYYYAPAIGGPFLANIGTFVPQNVAGAIQPYQNIPIYYVREDRNNAYLEAIAWQIIIACSKWEEILQAPEGTEMVLPRYVRITDVKGFSDLTGLQLGPNGRFDLSEFQDQITNNPKCLQYVVVKDPGFKPGGLTVRVSGQPVIQYYPVSILDTITIADKRGASISFIAGAPTVHFRDPYLDFYILINYAPKYGGITPYMIPLGPPGSKAEVGNVWVSVPNVDDFPETQNEFVTMDLRKYDGNSEVLPATVNDNGVETPAKYTIILDRADRSTIYIRPYTTYDPTGLINLWMGLPHQFGANGIFNFRLLLDSLGYRQTLLKNAGTSNAALDAILKAGYQVGAGMFKSGNWWELLQSIKTINPPQPVKNSLRLWDIVLGLQDSPATTQDEISASFGLSFPVPQLPPMTEEEIKNVPQLPLPEAFPVVVRVGESGLPELVPAARDQITAPPVTPVPTFLPTALQNYAAVLAAPPTLYNGQKVYFADKNIPDAADRFAQANEILMHFIYLVSIAAMGHKQDPEPPLKVLQLAQDAAKLIATSLGNTYVQTQWAFNTQLVLLKRNSLKLADYTVRETINKILAEFFSQAKDKLDEILGPSNGIQPTGYTAEEFLALTQLEVQEERKTEQEVSESGENSPGPGNTFQGANLAPLGEGPGSLTTEEAVGVNDPRLWQLISEGHLPLGWNLASPNLEGGARNLFDDYSAKLQRLWYSHPLTLAELEEIEAEIQEQIVYADQHPGLLGQKAYVERLGDALTFDIFFTTTLPALAGSPAGRFFVSAALGSGAGAGVQAGNPLYADFAQKIYQAAQALPGEQGINVYQKSLAMLTEVGGGGFNPETGGSGMAGTELGEGGGWNPVPYVPAIGTNFKRIADVILFGEDDLNKKTLYFNGWLDDLQRSQASVAEGVDAAQALGREFALMQLVFIAIQIFTISATTPDLSTLNALQWFQLSLDCGFVAAQCVSLGVTLASISYASLGSLAVAATSDLVDAVSAVLTAFSGVLALVSIGLTIYSFVQDIYNAQMQLNCQVENTLVPDVSMTFDLAQQGIVRNGGLRPGDPVGLRVTVRNDGEMGMQWAPGNLYIITGGQGAFWYHSKVRLGAGSSWSDWTDYGGPWDGGSVDWTTWDPLDYFDYKELGVQQKSDPGDVLYPTVVAWHNLAGPGVPARWNLTVYDPIPHSATYTLLTSIPAATSELAMDWQDQFATTWNGRTNYPESVPLEVIFGDSNHDGRIDPTLGEEAVPVLENTLSDFLAHASSITPPVTVDDLVAKFAAAQASFQWADAASYARQIVAKAAATLPVNLDFSRLQDAAGVPVQLRTYMSSQWTPVSASADLANYDMLQVSGPTEWGNLVGGENGAALQALGWRPYQTAQGPTDVIFQQDYGTSSSDGYEFSEIPYVSNPLAHSQVTYGPDAWTLLDLSSLNDPLGVKKINSLFRGEVDFNFGWQSSSDGPEYIQNATSLAEFGLATESSGGGLAPEITFRAVPIPGTAFNDGAGNWYGPHYRITCNGALLYEDAYWTYTPSISVVFDAVSHQAIAYVNKRGNLCDASVAVPWNAGNGIPNCFFLTTGTLVKGNTPSGIGGIFIGGGSPFAVQVSNFTIRNIDDEGARLNTYSLTSPPGLLLVPKQWVADVNNSQSFANYYSTLTLPCHTNIGTSFNWAGVPTVDAGGSFDGTIAFAYSGHSDEDSPLVDWTLTGPIGWEVGPGSGTTYLQSLGQLCFAVDVPAGTLAGTYTLQFEERVASGPQTGIIIYSCQIPVRVNYNASLAFNLPGLPGVLDPGTTYTWASASNGGTVPQSLSLMADGLPISWLSATGYLPAARWDFPNGTSGWALVPSLGQAGIFADAASGVPALRSSQYVVGVADNVYFHLPAAGAGPWVSPVAATMYLDFGVTNDEGTLVMSPAFGWVNEGVQPGIDRSIRVWSSPIGQLAGGTTNAVPGLQPGVNYGMWLDGSVWGEVGISSYHNLDYAYPKVGFAASNLVLQAPGAEVVQAARNVSMYVTPGDQVRIGYENAGAAAASLSAGESFALDGSGYQERSFEITGTHALAQISITAAFPASGGQFMVDYVEVDKALSNYVPYSMVLPGDLGWNAAFGSGIDSISAVAPVTVATTVGAGANFDSDVHLAAGSVEAQGIGGLLPGDRLGTTYGFAVQLPSVPASLASYESFGSTARALHLSVDAASLLNYDNLTSYECGAFDAPTVTRATMAPVYPAVVARGAAEVSSYGDVSFDVSSSASQYFYVNSSDAANWWLFDSDDCPGANLLGPKVTFAVPKWGVVADGSLMVQTDQASGETFLLQRPDINAAASAGDKLWVSFEDQCAGNVYLTLVPADPAQSNVTFQIATAADRGAGTVLREFTLGEAGNFASIEVSGTLGAPYESFKLLFASLLHAQPSGLPFGDAAVGGFYAETADLAVAGQGYAPVPRGSFTFASSPAGFVGGNWQDGTLVLGNPAGGMAQAAWAASSSADDIVVPATSPASRVRVRYNSTALGGVGITFATTSGTFAWALPNGAQGAFQEAVFPLPPSGCEITGITIAGSFAAGEQFALASLFVEAPSTTPYAPAEVAGHRSVLGLENAPAAWGSVDYSFAAPQESGQMDVWVYAPGTNATLSLSLLGDAGTAIYLEISNWQLWASNGTGAVPLAGLFGGWHLLSIAWDGTNGNYTAWVDNNTLLAADYTSGAGVLGYVGGAIMCVRFSAGEENDLYFLDGFCASDNASYLPLMDLPEAFVNGSSLNVALAPGSEYTFQLTVPRSWALPPGTPVPVHFAIYDMAGNLVGMVDKAVVVGEFYDCSITCDNPTQFQWAYGPGFTYLGPGSFSFPCTVTNYGNVPQTFALSAPGLNPAVAGTFYADLGQGAGLQPVTEVTLAPGQSQAVSFVASEVPPIQCQFAIQATSEHNSTSIPVSFVYNAPPVTSNFDQGPVYVEWQPNGLDMTFLVHDDTTDHPHYEAYWYGPGQLIGSGTWASDQLISISLDPLLAKGASILGQEQDIWLYVYDGYENRTPGYNPVYLFHRTYIVDNVLPAMTGVANQTVDWANLGNVPDLDWTLLDQGTWAGWQDDFGSGLAGSRWAPFAAPGMGMGNAAEVNGSLQLPYPYAAVSTPVPAGSFAVEAKMAPYDRAHDTGYDWAGFYFGNAAGTATIRVRAEFSTYYNNYAVSVYTGQGRTDTVTTWALPAQFYLRVAVDGGTYSVWYSADGAAWVQMPQTFSLGDLQVMAVEGKGVDVDWIRCTQGTAPGASYSLYRDGMLVQAGPWADFSSVTYSLADLRVLGAAAIGTHDFTLVATDPVGGSSQAECDITVTQVCPALGHPGALSLAENEPATITWSAFDVHATNPQYVIYLGPAGAATTVLTSGAWASGGTISAAISGLAPGAYTCRLVATNGLPGGQSEDDVAILVTQAAITPPPVVSQLSAPAGEVSTPAVSVPAGWGSVSYAVDLTAAGPVTVTTAAWAGNPVPGSSDPIVTTSYGYSSSTAGAYFAVSVDRPDLVEFPVTVTVSLVGIYWYPQYMSQWLVVRYYDPDAGAWVPADATVLSVSDCLDPYQRGWDINATVQLDHFSLFAVGFTNFPPVLSSPAYLTFEYGSPNQIVAWTIADNTTATTSYNLSVDGAIVQSGAWANGSVIQADVSGLLPGAHVVELDVDDGLNGTAVSIVVVTVTNQPPAITAPPDLAFDCGAGGETIAWTVTDPSVLAPTYAVSQNSTFVASGAWVSGSPITIDVSNLTPGPYTYYLTVSDGLGGSANSSVGVTVRDVPPVLQGPASLAYEFGTPGQNVTWMPAAAAALNATYAISISGFAVANGTWASGVPITYALPPDLLPGTWGVQCSVQDGYGGTAACTTNVTVTNLPPVITGPDNLVFTVGDPQACALYVVTDSSAFSRFYTAFLNGSAIQSGAWAGNGEINVTLASVPPGNYSLVVRAWDGLGGVGELATFLASTDTPTTITAPADTTYEVGTAHVLVNWTAEDLTTNVTSYQLFQDGVPVASGSWTSGVPIVADVGGLRLGTYNFTLATDDGYNGTASGTQWVTVVDTPPTVVPPANVSYEAGDPRWVVAWTITDPSVSAPTYNLLISGVLVASGAWASGVPVMENVSGFAPGLYNVTLVASDGYGAVSQGTCWVAVRPDDETTCTISNLTCTATADTVAVTCDLTDPRGYSSLNYFHVDGVTPANLTLSITGLHATLSFPNTYGVGWHQVAFSLTNNDNDYPGDQDTSVFTISFLNNVPPAVTAPANISGEVGSLNATLSWTIVDAYTNGTAYTIYCNGTVVAAGSWDSGVPVAYSTGFLMPGAWNFTLVASDGYGGVSQGSCWVTVTDTPPMVFAPANASYAEGVLHWVVNWTVTDPSVSPLAAYLLLLNGTVLGHGTWVSGTVISEDIGGLAPGFYNATMVAADGYGATSQGTFWVTVADVPPAIAAPPSVLYVAGTPGASITWTVTAGLATVVRASLSRPARSQLGQWGPVCY